MDTIELKTCDGIRTVNNDAYGNFLKDNLHKTIKEVFNLGSQDAWLKETSFHTLDLSQRAHNTIAQSFAERDPEKQTLDYVTDYTVDLLITRRNVGNIGFKDFMLTLYKFVSEKDKESGRQRNISFDPEIFK